MADFGERGQAHVFFGGEAVAVECRRPGVTLAGQHGGAAVPHSHTQAAAWLDKAVGWQKEKENLVSLKLVKHSGGGAGGGSGGKTECRK